MFDTSPRSPCTICFLPTILVIFIRRRLMLLVLYVKLHWRKLCICYKIAQKLSRFATRSSLIFIHYFKMTMFLFGLAYMLRVNIILSSSLFVGLSRNQEMMKFFFIFFLYKSPSLEYSLPNLFLLYFQHNIFLWSFSNFKPQITILAPSPQ